MDFWGALRVLRRRWYIALPSALVAIGLAAGVYVSIPTRYQSTGVMVLTSPAAGGTFSSGVTPEEAIRVNPLLAFDSSLSTTSQIVAQILADPKTREKLGITKDSTSNFTAAGGGQNGPFMFVVTDSESPDEAEKLVTTVLDFARTELDGQQRKLNAPESTFITSQVLVSPTTAEAQIGGKVRYGGAAFVLMMLLTLAVTFASDSVLGHLRRRRESAATKADDNDQDEEPARSGPPGPDTGGPDADQPLNGRPRRPDAQPPGAPVQRPAPPRPPRRPASASDQTMKVQPTASEKTVKIAAVNLPEGPAKPGGPAWPTREDAP